VARTAFKLLTWSLLLLLPVPSNFPLTFVEVANNQLSLLVTSVNESTLPINALKTSRAKGKDNGPKKPAKRLLQMTSFAYPSVLQVGTASELLALAQHQWLFPA
jgi:hypothetical protein